MKKTMLFHFQLSLRYLLPNIYHYFLKVFNLTIFRVSLFLIYTIFTTFENYHRYFAFTRLIFKFYLRKVFIFIR